MHYIVYLSHHNKMFLIIHGVFVFLRKDKRVVGQQYWTQLKNPNYLGVIEMRLGRLVVFMDTGEKQGIQTMTCWDKLEECMLQK